MQLNKEGRSRIHGRMGNWLFIETLEATDAEEKCLLSVVGLWSPI
jgi:hypothetical protein